MKQLTAYRTRYLTVRLTSAPSPSLCRACLLLTSRGGVCVINHSTLRQVSKAAAEKEEQYVSVARASISSGGRGGGAAAGGTLSSDDDGDGGALLE